MKIYCVLLIILSSSSLLAQSNFGPKLLGMGNNGTSVLDIWTVLANPAGISYLTKPAFALSYQKNLFSNEISTQSLAAVLPFKNNFIGFGAERYGFSIYNELKASFSYSKLFGENFSMGLKASLHQLKISNYGSKSVFSIDAGAFYHFSKEIIFAAYASNLSNQQYLKSEISATIPASFSLGGSYQASDKVLIAVSAGKILNQKIDTSLGIDYKILEILSLRAGLSANPFKQYLGFGISYSKFRFDAASAYNNNLGYSPQIGIAYEL